MRFAILCLLAAIVFPSLSRGQAPRAVGEIAQSLHGRDQSARRSCNGGFLCIYAMHRAVEHHPVDLGVEGGLRVANSAASGDEEIKLVD